MNSDYLFLFGALIALNADSVIIENEEEAAQLGAYLDTLNCVGELTAADGERFERACSVLGLDPVANGVGVVYVYNWGEATVCLAGDWNFA